MVRLPFCLFFDGENHRNRRGMTGAQFQQRDIGADTLKLLTDTLAVTIISHQSGEAAADAPG